MADSQVKTANICNITSSTLFNSNAGGRGTYISDNNISVYMSGTATWSGTFCKYIDDALTVGEYYTISFTPICATNTTLQIELAGVQRLITFTSGVRQSVTVQASTGNRNVAFYGGDTVEKTVIIEDIQIEKGETATPYRPYSATGWAHSLRKLTTATEAVENPLYSDGTAITAYTLKGNTVQNGTPTPSAPIAVQGVGELDSGQYKIPIPSGGVTTNIDLGNTQSVRAIKKLVLDGTENWESRPNYNYADRFLLQKSGFTYSNISGYSTHFEVKANLEDRYPLITYNNGEQIVVNYTPKGTTTLNQFKQWLQDEYAYGTPVTIWYVLRTAETAAVNEPLMKIGAYADTLSNATAIPTTEGANSITVDTTVQPSEFTATWTGWHNANVKEWDGSDWN